jgi:hypothetical protein
MLLRPTARAPAVDADSQGSIQNCTGQNNLLHLQPQQEQCRHLSQRHLLSQPTDESTNCQRSPVLWQVCWQYAIVHAGAEGLQCILHQPAHAKAGPATLPLLLPQPEEFHHVEVGHQHVSLHTTAAADPDMGRCQAWPTQETNCHQPEILLVQGVEAMSVWLHGTAAQSFARLCKFAMGH